MTTPLADSLQQEVETRECRRCHTEFEAQVIRVDGRRFCARTLCLICADILATEEMKEQAAAAEFQRARNRELALKALDAPPLFAESTIADLGLVGSPEHQQRLRRAVQVARRIVHDLSNGIDPIPFTAFLGAPGTGKTMLAWAIAQELCATGIRSRVVRLSALVRDLRAAWRDKEGPDEDSRLRSYIDVPFLAIDEVSRHAFYGQQIHQHLYDVINARLEWRRPTVLTSNETQEGLAEILGPALMDCLATGGIVQFGIESYRRRPKEAA